MEAVDVNASRRRRWEARTGALLLTASAFFLLAYSLLVLAPRLTEGWRAALILLICVIWAAYVVDLIVRLSLTPSGARAGFIRTHRSDVASTIVPLFRPFQLLKLLPRLRWFKGSSGDSVRSRLVVASLAYVVLFVYVIALAVLAVERNAPHATIVSFGDAIWWACVTLTTVGYGDYSPVTVMGRFLAVVLMAGGVAIIGMASATLVSYISERMNHAHRAHDAQASDLPADGRALGDGHDA